MMVNQQLNKKAKRTIVRLKRNVIEKRRLELCITSQEEAAKISRLNFRTYQRAISGKPISVRTARNICDALKLNYEDVVIIDQNNFLVPDGEGVHDQEKHTDFKTEAAVAVGKAIDSIFKSHEDFGSTQDLIDVLKTVLIGYALGIARQNQEEGEPHDAAFLFVDEITYHAKEYLYRELSGLKRIGESDEPS